MTVVEYSSPTPIVVWPLLRVRHCHNIIIVTISGDVRVTDTTVRSIHDSLITCMS